jgi:hypothetical protein
MRAHGIATPQPVPPGTALNPKARTEAPMKRIMTRVLPAFFFLTVSAATAFAQSPHHH